MDIIATNVNKMQMLGQDVVDVDNCTHVSDSSNWLTWVGREFKDQL